MPADPPLVEQPFPTHSDWKPSRIGAAAAALPSVVWLLLFYSLAIHMHHSLGRWPEGIGEAGFPPELVRHANLATSFFGGLFALSITVGPIAFAACAFVGRWSFLVPYFVVHAATLIACIILALLAPRPFLTWWLD